MLYRRRILLGLLESLGGDLGLWDFQEHLFLFTRRQASPSFDFVPYHDGCYSFTAEADRQALIRQGLLRDAEAWSGPVGYSSRTCTAHTLTQDDQDDLTAHCQQVGPWRGDPLLRRIYQEYPYYATRSQQHLSAAAWQHVKHYQPSPPKGPALFTLGYEGKSLEFYLCALLDQGVEVLCDVRHNPVSRKQGFSRKSLQHTLSGLAIAYRHFPRLGIPAAQRRNLKSPAHYAWLFAEYERKLLSAHTADLDAILAWLAQRRRVALTCFERHPHQCHRSCLAKALKERFACHYPLSLHCEDL